MIFYILIINSKFISQINPNQWPIIPISPVLEALSNARKITGAITLQLLNPLPKKLEE